MRLLFGHLVIVASSCSVLATGCLAMFRDDTHNFAGNRRHSAFTSNYASELLPVQMTGNRFAMLDSDESASFVPDLLASENQLIDPENEMANNIVEVEIHPEPEFKASDFSELSDILTGTSSDEYDSFNPGSLEEGRETLSTKRYGRRHAKRPAVRSFFNRMRPVRYSITQLQLIRHMGDLNRVLSDNDPEGQDEAATTPSGAAESEPFRPRPLRFGRKR